MQYLPFGAITGEAAKFEKKLYTIKEHRPNKRGNYFLNFYQGENMKMSLGYPDLEIYLSNIEKLDKKTFWLGM